MPPKRNQSRSKSRNKHPKESKEVKANAMADCVFPQDIMLCILTRLPVKSLLRFKCVCKPWRKLFTTPKFMKLHYDRFCNDPRNEAFIIYSLSKYYDHTMSLFNIESNEKKPTNLDHPYPEIFFRMNFVGCCNGLLCMGCPPLGQGIVLWNPAMSLSKFIPLSKVDFGVPEMVSLGFGYDAEGDDFKVVRIVCLNGKKMRVGVQVYSAKSDSWKTIKVGFQFKVFLSKNDAIVKGNPYWLAKVDENGSVKSHLGLVWLDVKQMECKTVPLSNLIMKEGTQIPLVDWKGSVAAIMCSWNEARVESVYVWVFDDGELIWKLNHTFGPIELKVGSFLQCSKNGKIIGECLDGKLFVFDHENGCTKVTEIDEAQQQSYEVYGYYESLACVEGMKPLVMRKGEDGDDPMAGPAIDAQGLI